MFAALTERARSITKSSSELRSNSKQRTAKETGGGSMKEKGQRGNFLNKCILSNLKYTDTTSLADQNSRTSSLKRPPSFPNEVVHTSQNSLTQKPSLMSKLSRSFYDLANKGKGLTSKVTDNGHKDERKM
jgi:hypothetical protein